MTAIAPESTNRPDTQDNAIAPPYGDMSGNVSYALAFMQQDASDPSRRLILENMNLVYFIVRKLTAHNPLDYEEALSDGFLGLVAGAHKFDHGRDIMPTTFLAPRIRGAILDGKRNRDYLTRLMRKRKTQVRQATTKVAARLLRTPTSREVAEELGVSVERYWKWEVDMVGDEWVSLDDAFDLGAGLGVTLAERFGDTKAVQSIGQFEAARSIEASLYVLNPQQRMVFGLYYGDGFKLHEIAEHLGLTESRISQIVTASKQALLRAMTRLNGKPTRSSAHPSRTSSLLPSRLPT